MLITLADYDIRRGVWARVSEKKKKVCIPGNLHGAGQTLEQKYPLDDSFHETSAQLVLRVLRYCPNDMPLLITT